MVQYLLLARSMGYTKPLSVPSDVLARLYRPHVPVKIDDPPATKPAVRTVTKVSGSPVFLRWSDVEARIGHMARSTRDAKEKAGEFPRRVQFGPRRIVWVAAEIEQWQQAKIAERDRLRAEAARRRAFL
jgi:prophage regulatory protein